MTDERKPLQRSDVQIWAMRSDLGNWSCDYSFWAEAPYTIIVFRHLGQWWSGMAYKKEVGDAYHDQIWDVKLHSSKREAMKSITGLPPRGFHHISWQQKRQLIKDGLFRSSR